MHPHQLVVTREARQARESERGASLVEYAMLLALIAVVVMGAVSFFGDSTSGNFGKSTSCIEVAYGGAVPSGCE